MFLAYYLRWCLPFHVQVYRKYIGGNEKPLGSFLPSRFRPFSPGLNRYFDPGPLSQVAASRQDHGSKFRPICFFIDDLQCMNAVKLKGNATACPSSLSLFDARHCNSSLLSYN